MPKTEAEIAEEVLQAKRTASRDANRRKLMYVEGETAIVTHEHKVECLRVFYEIVQRYAISQGDMVALLEAVPYI